MPALPRFYVGVGAARGQVFVVGGFRQNRTPTPVELDVSRAVHAYDTTTAAWKTLAPLPASFEMANVAGVGERLFVLGGLENTTSLEYDFAADAWLSRAPLPVERGRGAAAVGVHGTRVLLAGGILRGQSANNLNTGMRVPELLAYDTVMDTWQVLPAMPQSNGYAMGAILGNEFWVLGGSTDFVRTDEVLAYDLVSGAWTVKPALPRTLSSAAVAVLGGRIYLTGGIATSVGMISPDTMVLDPATGMWSTVAPLGTPRFGTGGAVVDGRLYVPTGLAMGATEHDFQTVPTLEVFIP